MFVSASFKKCWSGSVEPKLAPQQPFFIWPTLPAADKSGTPHICSPHHALRGAPRPVAEVNSARELPLPPCKERAVDLKFGEWQANVVLEFDRFADVELWVPKDENTAIVMLVSASRIAQVSPWLAQSLAAGPAHRERVMLPYPGPPAAGMAAILEVLYSGEVNKQLLDIGSAALAWLERLGVTPGRDHPWRSMLDKPGCLLPVPDGHEVCEHHVAYLWEPWCSQAYARWLFEGAQGIPKILSAMLEALPPDVFVARLACLPSLGDKLMASLEYCFCHKDPWPDADVLRAGFADADWNTLTYNGLGVVSALRILSPLAGSAVFFKLTQQAWLARGEDFLERMPWSLASEKVADDDCNSWPSAAHPCPPIEPVKLMHAGLCARELLVLDALGDIRLWLPTGTQNEARAYQVSASRLANVSPFFGELLGIARQTYEREIVMRADVASADGFDMLLRLFYGVEVDFADLATLHQAYRWLDYLQVEPGAQSPWHWLADRFELVLHTVLADPQLAKQAYAGILGDAPDAVRWAKVIELGWLHGHAGHLKPRLGSLTLSEMCAILRQLDNWEHQLDLLVAYLQMNQGCAFSTIDAAVVQDVLARAQDREIALRASLAGGLLDAEELAKTLGDEAWAKWQPAASSASGAHL